MKKACTESPDVPCERMTVRQLHASGRPAWFVRFAGSSILPVLPPACSADQGSWHRIEAAASAAPAEWMAARHSPQRHHRAAKPAISGDGNRRIFRTRGKIAATTAHRKERSSQGMYTRRNPALINVRQRFHAGRAALLFIAHEGNVHREISSPSPPGSRGMRAEHRAQSA